MSRWKPFVREKGFKKIYLIQIKDFPDLECCTREEAKSIKKKYEKLGFKVKIKRVRDGRCLITGKNKEIGIGVY